MSEVFKTEFRGYDKQQVTDYIMSLSSQLEDLKSQIDGKDLELSRLRAKMAETEQTEDAENALREKLYSEIEQEIRAKLESEIENKYKQSKQDGIYVLREELDALKEKAQIYDQQKEMLAELMIKARTDAADVYNQAEKRSEQLINETFEKLERLANDFKEMKKNVLVSKSEMDTRLTTIRHYLDDFTQYLDLAGSDIDNTLENFKQNV